MKPLLLLLLLLLTACSPKLAPTIVPAPSHDTLIAHHHTLDSIYLYESEKFRPAQKTTDWMEKRPEWSVRREESPFGSFSPDTLVVTRIKEHWRIRHDTIRVVHCDSIPYAVEVPIEVAKPIPRFYKNCTLGFFLILLCIILYVFLRIYLRR